MNNYRNQDFLEMRGICKKTFADTVYRCIINNSNKVYHKMVVASLSKLYLICVGPLIKYIIE